jgi:hypothetical protein
MKSIISSLAFVILCSVTILSCKKNDSGTSAPPVAKNVYIAGYEETNAGEGIGRYWKDTNNYSISSVPDYIEIRDIDVSGTDIYTMGEVELNAGGSNTFIWKNGISIYNFPQSVFIPYEMIVAGSDIYLAGSVNSSTAPYLRPAYWKNGVVTTLPQTSDYASATSIHIDGTDIYAAGWDLTANNTQYQAKYWKNGVAQTVTDCPRLHDITTSGADIYVAGYDNSYKPAYWKNGTKVTLPVASGAGGEAMRIKLNGSDVYVCGSEDVSGQPQKAMLWKNGISQPLDGTANAYTVANDMDIDGSTIYLCGVHYANGGQYRAVYWKNGTLTYLNNNPNTNYAEAMAIRVK